jgi:hypothetical protein
MVERVFVVTYPRLEASYCDVGHRTGWSDILSPVRRLLPVLLGLLLVLGGIYGLMTVFSGRDDAGIEEEASAGPGTLEPASTDRPSGSGRPPTSGTFERRNVTRQGRIRPDELLTALAQGNVVILRAGGPAPAALTGLQEEVSGPFDPELAAAGQMIVLATWPGLDGIQALAWRRRLNASGPDDPRLRAFAEAWLGQGRGRTG